MRSKGKVNVDEAVIEFLVDGAGDYGVLVPGGGLDGSYFGDFSGRLAQAGFRAVTVNPRGAGESTGPLDGLTLHTLAADVAGVIEGALRDQLGARVRVAEIPQAGGRTMRET